jgi:hypothetical protein
MIINRGSGHEKGASRHGLARHPPRRLAVLLLALPSLVIAAAVPAAASTSPAPPSLTAKAAAVTAAPVPPSHTAKPPAAGRRRAAAADCSLLVLSSFTTDSLPTIATGASADLTATTTCDVGPTPWWIQIYDGTTGDLLADCGSGTSCGATVSQGAATTHTYFAFLDLGSTAWRPAADTIFAQGLPILITWEAPPNDFVVSLSGPATVPFGTPGTYTATTNQDVGPTPYFIEIYDVTNPDVLAVCASGTSCSASFTPSQTGDDIYAFVAPLDGEADGAQASSRGLLTVGLPSGF